MAPAAARIRLHPGRCRDVLAEIEPDGADAVFLAPMFDAPRAAPPGYPLFRAVAVHDPLDRATVAEALRVAPRLAVKVPAGAPVPVALERRRLEHVEGRAVDYWVARRTG